MRAAHYTTWQREAIRDYLASLRGEHVTVEQIMTHFAAAKQAIGRTTVYRYLDKLVQDGQVRKYTVEGLPCACFQFIEESVEHDDHFHLKCEQCGELQHLECDILSDIQQHVLAEHAFRINALKTVFYGVCGNCLKEA
jgi:Fur family ferric uptake transcriptional regulator